MDFQNQLMKDNVRNQDAFKSTVEEEVVGWGQNGKGKQLAMHVQSGKVWYVRQSWCNNMVAAYEQFLADGGTMAEFNEMVSNAKLEAFNSVAETVVDFGELLTKLKVLGKPISKGLQKLANQQSKLKKGAKERGKNGSKKGKNKGKKGKKKITLKEDEVVDCLLPEYIETEFCKLKRKFAESGVIHLDELVLATMEVKANSSYLVYNITHTMYHKVFTEKGRKPDRRWVFDDETCAMDIMAGATSTCYGDSGGPLVYRNGRRDDEKKPLLTLMAVTSSSVVGDCNPVMPVMYSDLKYYSDWLKGMHACIMLDRIKEWRSGIDSGSMVSNLRNKWKHSNDFWKNARISRLLEKENESKVDQIKKRRKLLSELVGSAGMIGKTQRAALTEAAFREFYVRYMKPFKKEMKQWCKFAGKLDDYYLKFQGSRTVGDSFVAHKQYEPTHPFNSPGFFPSLIDFTEWIDQGREEKYRRSWATPLVQTGDRVVNLNGEGHIIENLDFAFNIAVSMDVSVGKHDSGILNGFDVFHIPGVANVKVIGSKLTFTLLNDDKPRVVCSKIPFKPELPKADSLHLEVVLGYYKNSVKVLIDGISQKQCNRKLKWRDDSEGPLGLKTVVFGGDKKRGDQPIEARNVEVRTWEDPPVCCSEWNNRDGKCIQGC